MVIMVSIKYKFDETKVYTTCTHISVFLSAFSVMYLSFCLFKTSNLCSLCLLLFCCGQKKGAENRKWGKEKGKGHEIMM